MKTIAILGGYGMTGKSLARHLLTNTNVKIIIAGRNFEKAMALADDLNGKFNGNRVFATRMDAADKPCLLDGIKGADLLVVASPTTQHTETVVQACIETKVDYLDVQLDVNKLAVLRRYERQIKQTNLCFITEAGFHPGLPASLVRFAAAKVENPKSAVTSCYLNMGKSMPYTDSVNELMEVFKDYRAITYKGGAWTKAGSYEYRPIDFGGEIGRRTCYSMYFEELALLPALFPTLNEIGFYISGSNFITDWLITPIVFIGLKIAPQRGMRPLGKLMWWGMSNFSKPPYMIQLQGEVRGELAGKPVISTVKVSHHDGYELTAIPVTACLMQYLNELNSRPGLWMMGQYCEPVRLFSDMQKMGIKITSEIH